MSSLHHTAFAHALAIHLQRPVQIHSARRVGGGSINHALRLDTNAGPFFVKYHPSPLADLFTREAEGLHAMASSGTTLTIPTPCCVEPPRDNTPAFLILPWLEPGPRPADFDTRLGQGLAQLHRASAPRFGFDHDNYCGLTPQPNPWTDNWVTFYRDHRLAHLLSILRQQRALSTRHQHIFETLLERLDRWLDIDPEPPALIHGDLWSGNLHRDATGHPALIDPAAYYAHREAELGMMVLFGGFSSRVFDAYQEAYPLQAGWQDRLDLYTLYHVLNHAVLFGGGYLSQALGIAKQYVG